MAADTNKYPVSLLADRNCCDNHIECDRAPTGAIHAFMDPAKRRENHAEAVKVLLVRHADYYAQ